MSNKTTIIKKTMAITVLYIIFLCAFISGQEPDSVINIAVLDIQALGGLNEQEIITLSDRLRGELSATDRFNVIERKEMGVILEEQDFQQSDDCSEASCIVEVGQLLAVQKMVGGSIGLVGKSYSLNVKLIDVETGKIDMHISEDYKCSKEELVSLHINNVARTLAGLEKIKKKKLPVILIPIVAIGAGVGALAYYIVNKNDEGEPSTGDDLIGIKIEVPLEQSK